MSKYLGLFVSESTEHLESLARDLVALEKADTLVVGSANIDSMFRHAHSVKGMASSMGFEAIATLAHRVEDLVEAFRGDAALISRERVDLLLSAADVMLVQVRAAAEGRPLEDPGALQRELAEAVEKITGAPVQATRVANAVVQPSRTESAPVVPPVASGEAATASEPVAVAVPRGELALGLPPRFAVKVKIASTCQVPGVRGFLVHKRLSSLGNIFNLRPPLEDLKAGRIPEGKISLELETAEGAAGISTALGNISEVELTSAEPILATSSPPAPSRPAAPEAPQPVGASVTARTVRVRTELLDYFLDAAGELLLATARLKEMGRSLPESHRAPMEEGVYRLQTLVKDLHDKVMSARMTPLSIITDRLPRAARDIARRRGRDVDLVVTGAEIELDRVILDDLADPLLHVLRNAIDHGIEDPQDRVSAGKNPRGRVLVNVKRARDRVVVEIEDDGRGMDAEKLKTSALARSLITQEQLGRMTDREAFLLAYLPGVSTAKDLSEISGRGVGMDAVKRAVESVGGSLEIESEKGRGTRLTLRLPLTVAVVHLLLVGVGDEVYGLPIAKVLGAVETHVSALSKSRETLMLPHGQNLVPVHRLADLLGLPFAPVKDIHPYVVVEAETGQVALAVDSLLGQEEVVLKALSRPLDLVPGLSGVTILGSGRPIFILDVPRLLT